MRIISGFLKGRRIKELKGFHSRPTTDFAKEGLFNILEHSTVIDGALILDLFTGTGNISYEFISRGAKMVFSVDSNYASVKFVKKTSKFLNISKTQRERPRRRLSIQGISRPRPAAAENDQSVRAGRP